MIIDRHWCLDNSVIATINGQIWDEAQAPKTGRADFYYYSSNAGMKSELVAQCQAGHCQDMQA